jgi:hypothetical protein
MRLPREQEHQFTWWLANFSAAGRPGISVILPPQEVPRTGAMYCDYSSAMSRSLCDCGLSYQTTMCEAKDRTMMLSGKRLQSLSRSPYFTFL